MTGHPRSSDETDLLNIPAEVRRSVRLPWSVLLRNKRQEFWTKARGRRIKGQGMIGAPFEEVEAGFKSLVGGGFLKYNLPQLWVESRQIPQTLDRRVPREGARILDLGCGPGSSTGLICHVGHPSWTVVGFDLTEAFIMDARQEAEVGGFYTRAREPVNVRFECQDLGDPLRLDGAPVPADYAHMALSGGVVGLYMKPDPCRRLVAELHRVVMPGGFIALDAGPSIPARTLRGICEEAGFVLVGKAKSFVIEPRPKLIFQKPDVA